MKLFIIRYNLTKIILQSVADHNCDLRSTAVYFASAATEASYKTFHWLIAFHPNLTCPVVLHIFHLHQIFHVPLLITSFFSFNFWCSGPFAEEHYITHTSNQEIHKNVFDMLAYNF